MFLAAPVRSILPQVQNMQSLAAPFKEILHHRRKRLPSRSNSSIETWVTFRDDPVHLAVQGTDDPVKLRNLLTLFIQFYCSDLKDLKGSCSTDASLPPVFWFHSKSNTIKFFIIQEYSTVFSARH